MKNLVRPLIEPFDQEELDLYDKVRRREYLHKASPDMYEALQALLSIVGKLSVSANSVQNLQTLTSAKAMALNALAKARGE